MTPATKAQVRRRGFERISRKIALKAIRRMDDSMAGTDRRLNEVLRAQVLAGRGHLAQQEMRDDIELAIQAASKEGKIPASFMFERKKACRRKRAQALLKHQARLKA